MNVVAVKGDINNKFSVEYVGVGLASFGHSLCEQLTCWRSNTLHKTLLCPSNMTEPPGGKLVTHVYGKEIGLVPSDTSIDTWIS